MADETGGQLIIDGTSGEFLIVTDVWWPEEEALTPLWFGNDLEGDDTKIGPGDYELNPTFWAPTVFQIPMWFPGDRDHLGNPYDNVIEGLASNLAYWRTEILDPIVVARTARLEIPGQDDGFGTLSKLRLSPRGRRRPSGWPLMFEFKMTAPFAPGGGS